MAALPGRVPQGGLLPSSLVMGETPLDPGSRQGKSLAEHQPVGLGGRTPRMPALPAQRGERYLEPPASSPGLPENSPVALAPAPLEESSLQAEQRREPKATVEGEQRVLAEEAGILALSPVRTAQESAELQERLRAGTSSERGEAEVAAGGTLRSQNRLLQSSQAGATLLKEQLVLNCPEGESTSRPQLVAGPATVEMDRLRAEVGLAPGKRPALEGQLQEDPAKRPCPGSQAVTLGPAQDPRGMSQAGGSWQQPGAGPSAHSQQCSQELQNKLAESEATVRAQAERLERCRTLLGEPVVQQHSKQVQVDLQDLGYETCGKSENEADREGTPSPECEELEVFSKSGLLEAPGPWGGLGWGQPAAVAALQQRVRELTEQLQRSNKALHRLQHRTRSFSSTSDYASGAERLGKTAAEEDEGWQSDSVGAVCPPALQASRDLQRLVHRVALLEAQLPGPGAGTVLPEELQAATWPRKYDSLIQAQARELSHLRQTMREGRGVGHLLAQHLRDTVKSFEELLRGTEIDYYMGQGFREHLAQGSQLAERLSSKLSSRDGWDSEDKAGQESVVLRLSKELREKERLIESLEAKLRARCETPASSRALSESPRSASSASFLSDGSEAGSDGDLASECSQLQGEPSEQPACHLADVLPRTAALAPAPAPAESGRGDPSRPCSQHQTPDDRQPRTGLQFDPLAKPLSVPVPPAPGPCSFLPCGPPAAAPSALLGCCGRPGFSLAEVQQELHMLQRQLGESGPLAAPSGKPMPLASDFRAASAPSSHCLHAPHLGPQPGPLDSTAGAAFHPLWAQPHPSALDQHLPSACPASHKLTGADLLEGHLAEIRGLRQRLEESIGTNDRLRVQLENRLAVTTKGNGSPSNFCVLGQEAAPAQSSETRALREENHSLQLQLTCLSRELERLREAEAERQRLAEELAGQRQSSRRLQEEQLDLEQNNRRLARTVRLLEQQCEESQRLCQALCTELRVQETLAGSSPVAPSACSRAVPPGPPAGSALDALLAEVRALRRQLLHGVQLNSTLRQQLTQPQPQLQPPGSSAPFQDSSPSPPVRDVGMGCPASLPPVSALASPAHPMRELPAADALARRRAPALAGDPLSSLSASEGRCQVIGHLDDYRALKQQIQEGRTLVQQMASALRPALATHGTEALPPGSVRQLHSGTATLHRLLEQSAALLATWRTAPCQPAEELQTLRARVAEQEELLRSGAARLQRAQHLKASMELVLVSHLTQTHAVLKKARTNLEPLQNNKPQSSCPSSPATGPGNSPAGLAQHRAHTRPAPQAHGQKRSRPDTLKWQEAQSWPCCIQLPTA